jgi:hypothetical protein
VSKQADARREVRWREEGNARLTMRISGEVDREIGRLARQHRCSRRAVIEGLVLGTMSQSAVPADIAAAMRVHGFTLAEAEQFVEQGR